MKISQKLRAAEEEKRPSISFEYFPPKTTQGLHNLWDRIERMSGLGPEFIDITWHAGSKMSGMTCEMVATAQALLGLETCMHLTCVGMSKQKIDEALAAAYDSGCENILALRGDLPREEPGMEKKSSDTGEFKYAIDLVRYIRQKYGDRFEIIVAGYPEIHTEASGPEEDILHLKEKIDAGASVVITQMFYDVDAFINWVAKCRDAGITVPIIPGIMPIQTWDAFIRRAKWLNVKIPEKFMKVLEPVKDDDSQVRELGTQLLVEMIKRIMLESDVNHLHFYTMNLERQLL